MRLSPTIILVITICILTGAGCASKSPQTIAVQTHVDQDITAPPHNETIVDEEDLNDFEDFESMEDDFEDMGFEDFEEEFAVEQVVIVSDPWEKWNRGVYKFNDKMFKWILKPISTAYITITPPEIRTGTRNFFHNLAMPVRGINCLLQGKFQSAGMEVARFGVNSVVGVFGCVDAAEDVFGWQSADEDLGQTLAVWGVDNGIYLVWPFLGPSTVRDSLGRGGDYFLKPLSWADYPEVEWTLKGIEFANQATFSIENYEILQEEAIEPYIAMRDGYIQFRRKQVLE